MARSPVVIRARGHRHVTATHAKTFELATDDEIGPDASCVIGVGARADWDALGRLHGSARITIEAAGHRDELTARLSPFWSRGVGLVVRKSGFRGDDTLAVEADAAAADLDAALRAALAEPSTEVDVSIRVIEPTAAYLFTDRLEPRVPDGVRVVGVPYSPVDLDGDDAETEWEVLARPGAALAAAAAVLGSDDDLLVLNALPRGKRARAARLAAAPLVGVVTAGEAIEVGAPTASVVFRPGEVVAPVRLGPPGQRLGPQDRVFTVVKTDAAADPVTPLLQALLDEGVSARTLRNAVGRVPGLDAGFDYDSLLRRE